MLPGIEPILRESWALVRSKGAVDVILQLSQPLPGSDKRMTGERCQLMRCQAALESSATLRPSSEGPDFVICKAWWQYTIITSGKYGLA